MKRKNTLDNLRKERIEKKITNYIKNSLKLNVPKKVIDILHNRGYVPLLEENSDELTTLDNYNSFGNHITQDLFKTNNAMKVYGKINHETSRNHVLSSLYLLMRSYDFVLGNESEKYKPKEWTAMTGYKIKQLCEFNLDDLCNCGDKIKKYLLKKAIDIFDTSYDLGNHSKEILGMKGECNFEIYNDQKDVSYILEGCDDYKKAIKIAEKENFDEKWLKITDNVFKRLADKYLLCNNTKECDASLKDTYKKLITYAKKDDSNKHDLHLIHPTYQISVFDLLI